MMANKIIANKKILISVIIVCIIILLGIIVVSVVSTGSNDKPKDEPKVKTRHHYIKRNGYHDAKVVTSKKLKKEHCLDKVCVKNLTIYEGKDYNNIVLTIVNKTYKTVTGTMMVEFADKSMPISYKNLAPKKTMEFTIVLDDYVIKDTSDFKVRYLTDKESEKFIID